MPDPVRDLPQLFPPSSLGRLSTRELASWLLQQCQDSLSDSNAMNRLDPPERAVIELVTSSAASPALKQRAVEAVELAIRYVLSLPAGMSKAAFASKPAMQGAFKWLRRRPEPSLDALIISREEGERFLHVASQALVRATQQRDIPAGVGEGAINRSIGRVKVVSIGASLLVSTASLLRFLNNARYVDRSGYWEGVFQKAPDNQQRKELLVPVFEGLARASVEDSVNWLLTTDSIPVLERSETLLGMTPFLLRSCQTPPHVLAGAVEKAIGGWPDNDASDLWAELRNYRVYRPIRDITNRESKRLEEAWRLVTSEPGFASMSASDLRARLERSGIPLGDSSAAEALGEVVARMHLGWPSLDEPTNEFAGWPQRIWLMSQFPSVGSFQALLRVFEHVAEQLPDYETPSKSQLAVVKSVLQALTQNAPLLEHVWSAVDSDASSAYRRRLSPCLRHAATWPGAAELVLDTLVFRPDETRLFFPRAAAVICDYDRVLRKLVTITPDWLALNTYTLMELLPSLQLPDRRARLCKLIDAVNLQLTRGVTARPSDPEIAKWRTASSQIQRISMPELANKWAALGAPQR